MRKIRLFFLSMSLLIGLIAPGASIAVAADPPQNVIPNGSFEETRTTARNKWTDNIEPVGWTEWYPSGNPIASVDSSVYREGSKSVRIDAPTSSRGSIGATVQVTPGKSYKLSVWMKTANVVSENGVFVRTQYLTSTGSKVSDGPKTVVLKGTEDWTKHEAVMTVPATASKLKIEPFLETGTGTAWFDDLRLEEWDGMTAIKIEPSSITLEVRKSAVLTANTIPSGASSKPILWSSSNEEVASVDGGSVIAKAAGTAVIRAMTEDGLFYSESTVSVESEDMLGAYDTMRQKWFVRLTGLPNNDGMDADATAYLDQLTHSVSNNEHTGYWDTMDKNEGRTTLWTDLASKTDPYQFGQSYERLKAMALSYSIQGSAFYQNETLKAAIIKGMDWLYVNRYNERLNEYGNWYVWEISTPRTLNDLMVLMYADLSPEQLQNYLKAFDRFLPDPTRRDVSGVKEVGANLMDKAFNVSLRGVIGKSAAKIAQGLAPIGNEYKYTDKGDGVYRDGSVVQHFYVAYTGGYGAQWLARTADMAYILKDSPWPITDPNVSNVYDWVINAFQPIIYNGLSMDMVNGRGISRAADGSAKSMILSILRLADTAPGNKALAFKRMVKEWIQKDKQASYVEDVSLYEMQLVKSLMNDNSISPRGELLKHQVFAGMDRVVHLRPGFGLGISMFSDRISAFEYGNTENKKGWYTGIGMTTLYNQDQTQYRDAFWATVDSFRLAGTTTDRSGEGKTPGEWANYPNTKKWVGGSSLEGLYGAAGMDFSLSKVTGSSLSGLKSWFTFDDEIVALGAGITSTDNRPVETIVENRKLNELGGNKLTVDGVLKSSELGLSETLTGVHWAHLAGNVPGSDIGYYFPGGVNLKGLREARTGSYADINKLDGTTDLITRNYLSLAVEHGVKPSHADYSYVLLPGKDEAASAHYSGNPQIEIISNTPDVQAVHEKTLGITAANFWKASTASFITSNQPASVMVKEKNGELTISVSDPTQSQSKVTVEIAREGYALVSKDSTVDILQVSPAIKLEVNTSGALGATHTISLRKEMVANVVKLAAQDTNVIPGQTVILDLSLSQLTKAVVAEDITINYDAAKLEFIGEQNLREGLGLIEKEMNSPGEIRLLLASLGAQHAIADDATLLQLAFKVKPESSGSSEISIAEAVLADEAGVETAAETMSIVLNISGGSTLVGDLNGDGKVSIGDLAIISKHYGEDKNSPNWNEAKAADINGDGQVDLEDLVGVARKILE
ncbi:polysaccharide lyase family 8 super-sandwich domain-containing protein [Paenibacillus sp. FJAT-27812]|uniref:polysaccharide lyase family 8 super-sandwich domain-containing protein n=1 Tax=Paenibacillus sp. FJAT-27812 TaxID=1684143 RepID=UPI0006A79A74|nr:polysaccharide lyase family 8 super-sandwich domain-containing protein [Paenibacillus sp. FJAT-27812]